MCPLLAELIGQKIRVCISAHDKGGINGRRVNGTNGNAGAAVGGPSGPNGRDGSGLKALLHIVVGVEILERFAAGAFQKNLDFLLGVLQRFLATAR